jgi:predicted ATP-grasp superfamily ATP-dependent carboligase
MSDAATKIVRRLGLSGFVGFDFVIEDSTGKAFLIEINPRATQSCHLQLGSQSNLCAALCASLSGTAAAKKASMTRRETIVLWPHLAERLLPARIVDNAYFDQPRNDPEIVRLYGSSKRLTLSNVMKSLWKGARARAALARRSS